MYKFGFINIYLTVTKLYNSYVLIDKERINFLIGIDYIPYFFGYKTVFSFQNNPKDLDLSCKMDLDLRDCLGRVKLVLLQNFIGLI